MTTTTPRWALPKPEGTDLISNGWDAIADLADALDKALPRVVIKAADQSVTGSAALISDTHLFLDLLAGYTYEIAAHLAVSGNGTNDFKAAWITTGTMALLGDRAGLGLAPATTARDAATMQTSAGLALATALPYGTDAAAGLAWVREEMLIQCTVAGRLTLQWAQNAAGAGNTTVAAKSWLRAIPLRTP